LLRIAEYRGRNPNLEKCGEGGGTRWRLIGTYERRWCCGGGSRRWDGRVDSEEVRKDWRWLGKTAGRVEWRWAWKVEVKVPMSLVLFFVRQANGV